MKRTNYFHLSLFHILGVVIIITGIFLMWCAYNGTGVKKISTTEKNGFYENDEDIEDIEAYYSTINSRSNTAMRISLAIFGGLCIMGGIPVFYVSHADTIHKLPKRKKYDKKQEFEPEFDEEEFEFDYDNFDFDQYCFIERKDNTNGVGSDSDVINHIKSHYKKKDDKNNNDNK